MLNFVYDPSVGILREKSPRVCLCKITLVRSLQICVWKFRKCGSGQRCFAGLPRPGYRYEGVLAKQGDQPGSDVSFDHKTSYINVRNKLQVELAICARRFPRSYPCPPLPLPAIMTCKIQARF